MVKTKAEVLLWDAWNTSHVTTNNTVYRRELMSCAAEGWADEWLDVRVAHHGVNNLCQVGGQHVYPRSLSSADWIQVHSVPRLGTRRSRRQTQTVRVVIRLVSALKLSHLFTALNASKTIIASAVSWIVHWKIISSLFVINFDASVKWLKLEVIVKQK